VDGPPFDGNHYLRAVGRQPHQESSEATMKMLIARFIREEQGQDLIEYAFLAVFIALAVTLGLQAVATGINTQMQNIGTTVGGGS
jgi:Flp pilus assembly pilin Flp